jgi:hypothetical protein
MNTSATPVQASDKLQSLFERDERLIDVVASHSPQLAKLRHSPMRRIMARVTTVAQAARLCKMSVDSLVHDLNHAIGIDTAPGDTTSGNATDASDETAAAQWSIPSSVSVVELDVREELSKGGEPFSRIMGAVGGLGEREVLHLRAPFEPVPLFAVMQKRGFAHRTEQHADDDWSVWFFRQEMAVEFPTTATTAAQAADVTTPNPATPGAENAPARTEVWLDVRDMEPPEPLVRTLEALESLPADSMLVQRNMRVPQFLLPILRERGFHFTIDEPQSNEVHVRIWRAE